MITLLTLCAHSLQHLGVSRVPSPKIHFVLNQKAFGLDIKKHDNIIDVLIGILKKYDLDKVIGVTPDTFHTLPTAYKPERLILDKEESEHLPVTSQTIPDYLEHTQILCEKLMKSAVECFLRCTAHFSDASQWLKFSKTIFDVILKFPDLTYFVDIHEKNSDLIVREWIRQEIEKELPVSKREEIINQVRTMSEKQLEKHIHNFFYKLHEDLKRKLEIKLKELQASQTIRKRAYEFLSAQLSGIENAWKATALQASDRVKTEELLHTGGEEMKQLIQNIINSGKKYDEQSARKLFDDEWNENLKKIQSKFKEDEHLQMAIKYIYPIYHSFETKNLPSSDHIVTSMGRIERLSSFSIDELRHMMRDLMISEVSKHASIEEQQIVHSLIPKYSLNQLRGLTYLNKDVLCELLSQKNHSEIHISDAASGTCTNQATISDSSEGCESAGQPSIFSGFRNFFRGTKKKQKIDSNIVSNSGNPIALSTSDFRNKVVELLKEQKIEPSKENILPLLQIFDYIYREIEKLLLTNGTGALSIEISIIQKVVGIINTFLKQINLELDLFHVSLSKLIASEFHTVYVILLAKFYFKEQKDHFDQQIYTFYQMKNGLESYFLRMVVPDIKMDSKFAENCTQQIFEILQSKFKKQADAVINDEIKKKEKNFSRKELQKMCDRTHVGHEGSKDIDKNKAIEWHIRYIMKPNEIIGQCFDEVWEIAKDDIELKLRKEREKFAKVFGNYIFVLQCQLKYIKNKTKSQSGVLFIDELFKSSTGTADENLINKGKCMSSVFYSYLANKKIKETYTIGDIEYVLQDTEPFQQRNLLDPMVVDLMNQEQIKNGYTQCSINDFFEFLEKLGELGLKKKEEFELLPVDVLNLDSNDNKRKLFIKAIGCEVLCPCCNRPCDFDHTMYTVVIGSEYSKHQCQTGHQYRCMGGTRMEYTNEASIKMCEEMKEDDMIRTSTGKISWKEFKALHRDWDLDTVNLPADEFEKMRMNYAKIWGLIGQTLCQKPYYPNMIYVETNVDPTQHFILLLDNSGSMYDTNQSNRWSCLLNAVDKFLTIRKSSKTKDTASIIIFGNKAKIVCSNEDIKSADIVSKIKENERTVGSGTDFAQPIGLVKDTIKYANQNKIGASLIHTVIFLSDGEASYPKEPLETLKTDYGSVIANFWTVGLGSSNFSVLEKMNKTMDGTFKNITDPKNLVVLYAEIAADNSRNTAT